jgi:phenylalanyl-tRNA synthetase beta chain
MTISYNWLCTYLPIGAEIPAEWVDPEKLSRILTSLGLEVESMEQYESIKGGLKGVVIGKVLQCEKHPDADKLSVTKVDIGQPELLQIVCGAPNVAVGQTVAVATIGSTIYPLEAAEGLTMKKVKIRGVESEGMICAEDELGTGTSHDGIMVLNETTPGTPATEYFSIYTDWVYEIGLTPNRMDAMSHLGVARDVCAWLSHHHNRHLSVKSPLRNLAFKPDQPKSQPITVVIENTRACQRYSGISIQGVQVGASPQWLQQRLQSIGLRPINNIVDITNFILHETGQPLHAFDADKIAGQQVVVKNLPEGTSFVTLDEKERKLKGEDLMICNAQGEGMCIAGVFGGIHSGVTNDTTNIFLESAWFDPVTIRRTSFGHGLRTDAAARFEKGVDISQTLAVLKRAALLIREIAGGKLVGEPVDVYPQPKEKKQLSLKFHFLKKLSGKNYHADAVKRILESLDFELIKEGSDDLWFAVPYNKPDVSHPADVVEEIMRVDGYDNVEIPAAITIAPSPDQLGPEEALKEKAANWLAGQGFREILTNSITNSKYYPEAVLLRSVRMMNNLSADLDLLRPAMLETGLEVVARNLNHRNTQLLLFEMGNTYHSAEVGKYTQNRRLLLMASGLLLPAQWKIKASASDIYFLKGVVAGLLRQMGLGAPTFGEWQNEQVEGLSIQQGRHQLGSIGLVSPGVLGQFDIRQDVVAADLDWDALSSLAAKQKIVYTELSRFPAVERDLALVLPRQTTYQQIDDVIRQLRIARLTGTRLFDVFESDKLGEGKKSLAINFTFQDNEKTMTDAEVEAMMKKLTTAFQQELNAEIRNS